MGSTQSTPNTVPAPGVNSIPTSASEKASFIPVDEADRAEMSEEEYKRLTTLTMKKILTMSEEMEKCSHYIEAMQKVKDNQRELSRTIVGYNVRNIIQCEKANPLLTKPLQLCANF